MWVSRTRSATRRTSSGRTRSGSRTRSSTRSTCSSGRTRSPRRRSCRSTGTARTPSPSTRPATRYPAGTKRTLPPSTIYGFNGTFPGPRINAEYGKPVLVRFENHLDENPLNLDRQDFGSPDYSFLTHLHNGHTAPESDGNPHYSFLFGPKDKGFPVRSFVDQLYLNWPAGNDSREKQSFFWFHDHRMDHTGSNVYKGMVGLYPIYDPENNLDAGDETQGLRLPGVRTNHADGSFDVDFDIPLALYDTRLDDGVTNHKDFHDGQGEFPAAGNPRTHPEWWGKTFYKHFPNHGFVGDIFTINGTAYPVLEVKRRKYRFRFLDASISRIYDLKLMTSTKGPKTAISLGYKDVEMQGQYRIEDAQQCMRWTEIADDGGLLPFPITRDNFELWPAKRREHIVDFTKYQDGSPTKKGDVIWLTNTMKMPDGRMWNASSRFSADPRYKIPMMKIVIGDDAPDNSVLPGPTKKLRDLPPLPSNWQTLLDDRLIFEVQRGSARRRDRVAHQRQGVRPDHRAAQPDEQGRSPVPGDAEEELLQPVGDPQRRRRLGAPLPPAHGRAPDRDAERQGRDGHTRSGPPGRHLPRGPRGAGPVRVHDHLPRVPGLRRTVRRALPQPRARGPRHDVRLDDRAVAASPPRETFSPSLGRCLPLFPPVARAGTGGGWSVGPAAA